MRYSEAIASFEKGIAIYKSLPDRKRELARMLIFLAGCLAEYGNDDLSLKVRFESIATYADAGLDSSIECLGAVVILSAVGIKNKKYRESEEIMQIALKVTGTNQTFRQVCMRMCKIKWARLITCAKIIRLR